MGSTYLLAFLGFWRGKDGPLKAPELQRPALAGLARGRRAGFRWVGPLSGSLFAVTVLGAGLSDRRRSRGHTDK